MSSCVSELFNKITRIEKEFNGLEEKLAAHALPGESLQMVRSECRQLKKRVLIELLESWIANIEIDIERELVRGLVKKYLWRD